jgi:PAS domain S-box-containing protein
LRHGCATALAGQGPEAAECDADMKPVILTVTPRSVGSFSAISLAKVLDQSVDCVKIIGLDGKIEYMNHNGLCAMEVDDFCALQGKDWSDLWPEPAKMQIIDAQKKAALGETVQFLAFCPTSKGNPRWWDISVSSVNDDNGNVAALLSISRDVTENEQSREALKVAAAELKHRLKNTYQMISSLMTVTAQGNPDNELFAQHMAVRLIALSRAQLLFAEDDAPCDLAELIPALLTPFESEISRVSFGTLLQHPVQRRHADAIALVIGELAMNAVKHGVFEFGGVVHVDTVRNAESLSITWRERCDRAVQQQSRVGGQGIILMERIMRARNGSFEIEWNSHGIDAVLTIPTAD